MYFTRNVRNRVRPLIGYSLILQVSKSKNIQCNIASFPFIYCIINTIQYPTMSCIFVQNYKQGIVIGMVQNLDEGYKVFSLTTSTHEHLVVFPCSVLLYCLVMFLLLCSYSLYCIPIIIWCFKPLSTLQSTLYQHTQEHKAIHFLIY